MSPKQTLYEVLAVSPTASIQEILEAYQQRWNALQAEKATLSAEDFSFRQQLLTLARSTLGNPDERSYYDAKLASTSAPEVTGLKSSALMVSANSDSLSRHADTLARHADTLALHADALALRAEAMAIRAGLPGGALPPSSGAKSRVWRTVMIVATVIACLMVLQMISMYFGARRQQEAMKAEEKIIIQEYYQTYGVRPASAAEARLLEAERRRKESEERAAERAVQQEEFEKRQAENEYERSREEVKRLGDQVTSDLNRAEEAARIEEAEAAAKKQRQLDEEARRKEEAEALRLQQLKEKWQRTLSN